MDLELDLTDLIPEMETRYEEGVEILKLERLKRKTDLGWIDSQSVKVTFSGKSLPRIIIVSKYTQFRVRPYVGLPRQCFNCQRPGHMANGCTFKTRCLICSGEHNKKDCDRSNCFKCANCGGDHIANSKFCPIYSVELKIEKVKAQKQIAYSDARNLVLREKEVIRNETASTQRQSYRNVLAPPPAPAASLRAVSQEERNENLDISSVLEMVKNCIIDVLADVLKSKDIDAAAISEKVETHFLKRTRRRQSSSSIEEEPPRVSDSAMNMEDEGRTKRSSSSSRKGTGGASGKEPLKGATSQKKPKLNSSQ